MKKGQKHTLKSRVKMRLSHVGYTTSQKTREKISDSMKGKSSSWLTGRKLSKQHKENIGKGNKGKHKWSLKMKTKMSNERIGSKNPNWKGGTSPRHKLDRMSLPYRVWREKVFKRDDYTCQECGKRGCYLEPHHIKPFALFPELRFVVSNGITLCKKCHKKTPSYRYSKIYNRNFDGDKEQESCPECGTPLVIIRNGIKEEAECPGCGYYEA